MITRSLALSIVNEHVANKNIVKHMLATEALMGGLFDELKNQNKTEIELGGSKEEWEMAGLLHDGDYTDEVPMEKQGIQISLWVREKGLELPENVSHAMAAHNFSNTKVEPENLMDWAIFLGDSLTGLIVASALVLPSKKLADLSAGNVLKRFREKSFAKGTRREDILKCEEKLGLDLSKFVTIALNSMQKIDVDLGL